MQSVQKRFFLISKSLNNLLVSNHLFDESSLTSSSGIALLPEHLEGMGRNKLATKKLTGVRTMTINVIQKFLENMKISVPMIVTIPES